METTRETAAEALREIERGHVAPARNRVDNGVVLLVRSRLRSTRWWSR